MTRKQRIRVLSNIAHMAPSASSDEFRSALDRISTLNRMDDAEYERRGYANVSTDEIPATPSTLTRRSN